MTTPAPLFPQLEAAGFDLEWTYHADAILRGHFSDAISEWVRARLRALIEG